MESNKFNMSPLKLMQQFYNDYNGKSKNYSTLQINCKYAKNKSSNTDKMTRFLSEHKNKNKQSYQSNQVAKTLTPSRYKGISEDSKRCYFKNSFSNSHPFLMSDHNIELKQLQPFKSLKTQPLQYINKIQNFGLRTPAQNRQIENQMKIAMIRIRNLKRQKMDKVRYNYLVNTCYKNYKQKNQQNPKLNNNWRASSREFCADTKQRIFPNSRVLKL